MGKLWYRAAEESDIAGMAEVRAGDWETAEFWRDRILWYLTCQSHPRDSLDQRIAFVCLDGERVVGLIAGHLTKRFGCHGELQWISVRPEYRGGGIASDLLRRLAEWFIAHNAHTVCVDVKEENVRARRFYSSHCAEILQPSWLVWKDIREVLPSARSF